MASITNPSWGDLPDPVLLQILSYLGNNDRYAASLVCHKWNTCFSSLSLWRHFTFKFSSETSKNQLAFIDQYGNQLKSAEILVNPQFAYNCENLCQTLTALARCQERRLEELKINFLDDPKLFFRANDILSSLSELFGPPDPNLNIFNSLRKVDLSGLPIAYSDTLFVLLASSHPRIEELNIQNQSLTCKVRPHGLCTLVQKCKELKKLSCFYSSVSEEIIEVLLEDGRVPLESLSFACIRDDKFHKPLTIAAWEKLVKKYPGLRVSFYFDHTIERHNIMNILHPPIPLVDISLHTMCEMHHEVSMIDTFYSGSLERFVIITQGTEPFQRALLRLIGNAPKLSSLHCLCGLDGDTIQKIKTMKPDLKSYTLRTKEEFDANMPSVLVGMEARTTAMDVGNTQEQ